MASPLVLHARLELLRTLEGGVPAAIPKRFMFHVDIGRIWRGNPVFLDARVTLLEGDVLEPGKTGQVLLEPLAPELWARVETGHAFTVHEGRAQRGQGVVTARTYAVLPG